MSRSKSAAAVAAPAPAETFAVVLRWEAGFRIAGTYASREAAEKSKPAQEWPGGVISIAEEGDSDEVLGNIPLAVSIERVSASGGAS